MNDLWLSLVQYFLYFCYAAFLGWIVETIFRSLQEKRFVNAGFLTGPFVPIYGFGALSIAALSYGLRNAHPALLWGTIMLAPTIVEYVGAWLLERFFGLTLWDYRDQKFNLQGRICLRFSLYWAILAVGFKLILEPLLLSQIQALHPNLALYLSGFLSGILIIDIIHSSKLVFYVKSFVAELQEAVSRGGSFFSLGNLISHSEEARRRLPLEIRRILKPLNAFSSLKRLVLPNLQAFPEWIQEQLKKRLGKK
ncbi:MAG TPA: putative ABC transporter permease [Termitinemataceae bacterium]|nr:putative ABC transporter permease [Termitinemataceae bacterium]HOM23247.1 putative ABC transporter permease [Termitinemataceae bacterium]HPQ00205.1 putative ABC transporter permease [Termitinemataceae bacterium]